MTPSGHVRVKSITVAGQTYTDSNRLMRELGDVDPSHVYCVKK
jgi:hypothetical protein